MLDVKYCCRCKIDLPLNEFFKDRTRALGLSARCKKCDSKKNCTPERNLRLRLKRMKQKMAKKIEYHSVLDLSVA